MRTWDLNDRYNLNPEIHARSRQAVPPLRRCPKKMYVIDKDVNDALFLGRTLVSVTYSGDASQVDTLIATLKFGGRVEDGREATSIVLHGRCSLENAATGTFEKDLPAKISLSARTGEEVQSVQISDDRYRLSLGFTSGWVLYFENNDHESYTIFAAGREFYV